MIKTTTFRKNLFTLLDKVVETGQPLEIERKGTILKVICEKPVSRLDKLRGKSKPKSFVGDSDDIINMDWSKEWRQESI